MPTICEAVEPRRIQTLDEREERRDEKRPSGGRNQTGTKGGSKRQLSSTREAAWKNNCCEETEESH